MIPKVQNKELIGSDVADAVVDISDTAEEIGDIVVDGDLEGAVEVAGSVGESVLELAGDFLGSIFD